MGFCFRWEQQGSSVNRLVLLHAIRNPISQWTIKEIPSCAIYMMSHLFNIGYWLVLIFCHLIVPSLCVWKWVPQRSPHMKPRKDTLCIWKRFSIIAWIKCLGARAISTLNNALLVCCRTLDIKANLMTTSTPTYWHFLCNAHTAEK